MEFGDILKQIRLQRGLTQEDLAALLHTSKQVISRYENKRRIPKVSVLAEYAHALQVPPSYLAGEATPSPVSFGLEPLLPTRTLPLVGSIACGTPILAEQNIEDYVSVPDGVKADFVLRCKGDSMIDARIHDGDVVYIRIQPDVEHGEIAAVLVDDEGATLKRVMKYGRQIVLMPANPLYEPLIFSGDDVARIRILGKAVAFFSVI